MPTGEGDRLNELQGRRTVDPQTVADVSAAHGGVPSEPIIRTRGPDVKLWGALGDQFSAPEKAGLKGA